MRPWSPDDLFDASVAVAAEVSDLPEAPGIDLDFVEDYPDDGLDGFLSRLEIDERESLYKLVSAEVREEIRREMAEENRLWLERGSKVNEELARNLGERFDAELKSVSHQALELAIAMAEQVVRRHIELDRDALLKALETVIYRAKRGTRFTIVVHPDDAEYINARPEDLDRLNIERVESDQRIERGGCLVEADGQELDYTVSGRLDRLEEVVRESVLESAADGEEEA